MSSGPGIRQREVLDVLERDPFSCGWVFFSDFLNGADYNRYRAVRHAVHRLEEVGLLGTTSGYFAGRERLGVEWPGTDVFVVDRLVGDPDLPPEWRKLIPPWRDRKAHDLTSSWR